MEERGDWSEVMGSGLSPEREAYKVKSPKEDLGVSLGRRWGQGIRDSLV